MKVLLITPHVFPVPAVLGGAVETLVTNFINEHEKAKENDIELYASSIYNEKAQSISKSYKKTKMIFVEVKEINKLIQKIINKLFKTQILSVMYQRQIYKRVKDQGIDKVVIEGGDIYSYKYLKRHLKNAEFISHIHGCIEGDIRINNIFTKNITISEFVNNKLLENGIIQKKNTVVLNNCIDISKFQCLIESDLKKELNIKEEIVITFCGRTIQEKGIRELIKAFKLMKNIDKCRLLIIGNSMFGNEIETEYDRELKEISESIKEKITFTGFIHNDNLYKYMNITDIFAVPSMWDEPSGLVILEGMACGLPIVATNVGGIPELVDKNSAILIDRDDNLIKNMAASLDYLVVSKDKRKKMGLSGIERVKKYSTLRYYNNFIDIVKAKN